MLREVIETDLPIFYEQQLGPESTRMAAFPAREEWTDFLAHWRKVLDDPTCCKQTIMWNGRVAGNVLEKCGFVRMGTTTAPGSVEEYLYRFG
jgi:hypothetical protein